MSSAIVRSTLRTAVRGGPRFNPAPRRSFSAGASAEEEAREASKWEKITYVGIVACSILAVVNLSKGHPHFEEPPMIIGVCIAK
ncbi:putative cytochrome c oxidase, subunit VIa [Helianthus annuus]|nr:putative cytochrome c oxidase, subunit VIa [Helianthus annuus]